MPPEGFRWMSAEEWDTSANLWLMIHNAEQRTGDKRKLSLFGAGCCRRHWSRLHPESQAVLCEFEVLIDQLPTPTTLDVLTAGEPLCDRANTAVGLVQASTSASDRWRLAAAKSVCYAVIGSAFGASSYFRELDPAEESQQIHILRDIFGNPFRPVGIEPVRRTEIVLSLAKGMYETRDFTAMPILADALEEAGCTHPEILAHLRRPGPHVRGCWPVDLCLGLS
jgi:hypothetical protein